MAGERKFFLGVGGEQTGPFTESEINAKIGGGEARADTLVWYEGLSEWQPLGEVAFFEQALKKGKRAKGGPKGGPEEPGESGEDALRPVFSAEEAVFFRRKGPSTPVLIGGGLVLMVGVTAFVLMDSSEKDTVVPRAQMAGKGGDPNSRVNRLAKADSEYLLNPMQVPDTFLQLIKEDSQDDVGQRATRHLQELYLKRRRFVELADLYLVVGRSVEAVKLLTDEKQYERAEQVLWDLYQKQAEPTKRREWLVKNIELLTGPLEKFKEAVPRIELLEKEYPNQPNPFAYYLYSADKKITDLFDRTSLFFVESLVTHIKAEFPQMKLAERPQVLILKGPKSQYRIVGKYKGDVALSHDKLKSIRFEYWMDQGKWHLVSTNLTEERTEWAKGNRVRYQGATQSAEQLLAYLEGVMRSQFPKTGLHQRITREDMQTAGRKTASLKDKR